MDKIFGKKIRELRENIPWDQTSLAKEIGVNVKTIQRIENGFNIPRKNTIKKLCIPLKIDFDELKKYLPNPSKIASDNEVIFYQVRYGREFFHLLTSSYYFDIDYHWHIVGSERFDLIHKFHSELYRLEGGTKNKEGKKVKYSKITWDYDLGKILASIRKADMGVYMKPYVIQHTFRGAYLFGNSTKYLQIYIIPNDIECVNDYGHKEKLSYAKLSIKHLAKKSKNNTLFYYNENEKEEADSTHTKIRLSQEFGFWYEFQKLYENDEKEWGEMKNDDYFGMKIDPIYVGIITGAHFESWNDNNVTFFCWPFLQDSTDFNYEFLEDEIRVLSSVESWEVHKKPYLKSEIKLGQTMAKEIIEAFRFKINPKKNLESERTRNNRYYRDYLTASKEVKRKIKEKENLKEKEEMTHSEMKSKERR